MLSKKGDQYETVKHCPHNHPGSLKKIVALLSMSKPPYFLMVSRIMGVLFEASERLSICFGKSKFLAYECYL